MILHIRVRPDCDPVIVAAQHSAEPDARTFQYTDFPDQNRIRRDPACVIALGRHAIESVNGHSNLVSFFAANYSHTSP
jgi:hypothetical protein